MKSGCPYCSGRRPIIGETDLTTVYPDIAAEAFGWDPSTVTFGSNRKLKWQCKKGHTWLAAVGNRTGQGQNCPFCSGHEVLAGYNDLASVYPEIAAQAHGWDPSTVMPGSNKKLEWQCAKGHLWRSDVNSRAGKNKSGCPVCYGRQVLAGYNDIATTHPEIATQAFGWDPTSLTAGSAKRREWQCTKGHTWKTAVAQRTGTDKTGCPTCSNRKVLAGYNDLTTTHPAIATQAFGWDPTTIVGGVNKKFEWKCETGHVWSATVNARTNGKTGCPICSAHQTLAGFNDLATAYPEIAAEAFGWDPSTVTAGSSTRREWLCFRGHTWKAVVAQRTGINKTGCPICSNKLLLVGYNDLATSNPDIAAEAFGWDPSTVLSGSGLKLEWQCSIGHIWRTRVAERVGAVKTDCPYCTNRRLFTGFNDLATVNPDIAAEAFGWDPTTVLNGSNAKFKWRCVKGHVWSTSLNSRTSRGSGCPSCAVGGFDPNKNGWLYFLKHESWGLFQIGISNVPKSRLRQHELSDWEAIEVRGPMPGDITYLWEQDILRALKRRGVVLGPRHIAGNFSGYTEAWIQEDFPASSLSELMQLVHDDDSGERNFSILAEESS